MTDPSTTQEWARRPERGKLCLLRLGVWIALHLGRHFARLFLFPTCVYFLISSRATTRSSRQYLTRVLDHRPTWVDVFRHYRTFASCLLDRVFLLNENVDQFEVRVHGEQALQKLADQGDGCLLFGAHFGSFEVARAVGRQENLRIGVAMYEENAQKIRAALAAINPMLGAEVIALGRPHSLISVSDRLARGQFVGLLVDRNVDGTELVREPFLGVPAPFPRAPFRMAALLKRPVVMMVGIYRGGSTYDVYFEPLIDSAEWTVRDRSQTINLAMHRYILKLESYCRDAPFNWFNFYDFWA